MAEAALLGPGAAELLAAAPWASVLHLPQLRPDNVGGAHFPLALTCTASPATSDVCAWLAAHKEAIEQALVEHGGLYLRGFPLADAAAFDAVMKACGVAPKPYVGGAAVRSVVYGDVFTSNESPPSETIPFHHGACTSWARHLSGAYALTRLSLRPEHQRWPSSRSLPRG